MRPLLFDVPPLYGRIFIAVLLLWVVPEVIGAFVFRSRETAVKRDRGSYLVLVSGIALGVTAAVMCATRLPALAITRYREALFWSGIALMVFGLVFRWYAIARLGRGFTQDVATHDDQVLVRSGPYRMVRHPAYTGTLATAFGFGLALGNIGSVVAVLAGTLTGLLYRIRVEERALTDAFGSQYVEYATYTRRLIPYVW